MINPNLAKLMSPADQEHYRKAGQLPDPAKQRKALQRNERGEQKVFSRLLHQKKIPFVNPRADQKSTIAEGHPDYTIFLPHGRLLMIEMKVAGGRLSPEQIARIAELRGFGHLVEVAWSADEAWKLTLKEYDRSQSSS